MKTIDDLKLQAYLDGELSAREAAHVESLLRQDTQAAALVAELCMTRDAIVANEPQATLPESLDFHWSKIARQIERQEATPVSSGVWGRAVAWLRYVAPASAVAAIAILAVLQFTPQPAGDEALMDSAPEVSPVVFQSQEESLTVIWLHGDLNSEFAAPDDGR